MTEPWLGHWNGCSIQYSNICDCDPDAPVEFPEDEPAIAVPVKESQT